MEYKIGRHTIEFSSGSSSIDPWTAEYHHKIGLSCWATSDIVPYIRIDGEEIHRIRYSNRSLEMREAVANGAVTDFDEFLFFFSDCFEGDYPNYSESVKIADEYKRKEDEYNAMSKEEKEEYMRKWREQRQKEIDKIREEKQGK
jgi:hypothetical protein